MGADGIWRTGRRSGKQGSTGPEATHWEELCRTFPEDLRWYISARQTFSQFTIVTNLVPSKASHLSFRFWQFSTVFHLFLLFLSCFCPVFVPVYVGQSYTSCRQCLYMFVICQEGDRRPRAAGWLHIVVAVISLYNRFARFCLYWAMLLIEMEPCFLT